MQWPEQQPTNQPLCEWAKRSAGTQPWGRAGPGGVDSGEETDGQLLQDVVL